MTVQSMMPSVGALKFFSSVVDAQPNTLGFVPCRRLARFTQVFTITAEQLRNLVASPITLVPSPAFPCVLIPGAPLAVFTASDPAVPFTNAIDAEITSAFSNIDIIDTLTGAESVFSSNIPLTFGGAPNTLSIVRNVPIVLESVDGTDSVDGEGTLTIWLPWDMLDVTDLT